MPGNSAPCCTAHACLYVLLTVAATVVRLRVAAASEVCDPMTTPSFRGVTPSPMEVLGIKLGDRPVTTAEADRYMAAVAAASDRVRGLFELPERSVRGQALNYVLVGSPQFLGDAALAELKLGMALLRDASTPPLVADEIIARSPSFTWVGACVHGGEKSGTDAALRVLFELADRDDCAANQILENQVMVILPNQNPDGRDDSSRRNANGFDMNRDWFSATQPETRGKLAVMDEYPPVLFCDIHEMGGTQYFFPPNADPYYHEISNASVTFINELYGAAMTAEFERQGIDFFTKQTFDLFYAGYGDSFPTLAWNAAGMTFEQGSAEPVYGTKVYNQYLATWISVSEAGVARERVLREWHQSFVTAAAQGNDGTLQANRVFTSGHEVEFQVPGISVHAYFLTNQDASKAVELATVLGRLAVVGVRVEELLTPLLVADYVPYGRTQRAQTLAAGTFVISTAQPAKHFIQSMLNEGTYVPFPYFYDLTGWSAPLMENTPGGWAASALDPSAFKARPVNLTRAVEALRGQGMLATAMRVDERVVGEKRKRVGSIAVLQQSANNPGESFDWLRFKLTSSWDLPYTAMLPDAFAPGALDGVDVLLVPHVAFTTVLGALGDVGRDEIVRWVSEGGHYIGWQGGAQLSSELGISMTQFFEHDVSCPGSFFRVLMDASHPLAAGVGDETFMYFRDNMAIMNTAQHRLVGYFPLEESADWFVSGFQEGAIELGLTVAVHQRETGNGLVTSFAYEVNFRAFTGGTSKMILNGIMQAGRRAKSPSAWATEQQQQQRAIAAGSPRTRRHNKTALAIDWTRNIKLSVPVRGTDSEGRARVERNLTAALRSVGGELPRFVGASDGKVTYLVPNSDGVASDEHPWFRRLGAVLKEYGLGGVRMLI